MEQKAKHRKVLRLMFKTAADGLLEDIDSRGSSHKIQVCWKQLQRNFDTLKTLDGEIFQFLLVDEDQSEEDLVRESEECSTYEGMYLDLQLKIEDMLRCSSRTSSSDERTDSTSKRKYKLPLIQMEKFDGSVKGWLPFWAQFKKIHQDSDIDPADKINYLRQCTIPNTKARTLVDSYPAVDVNYSKIIDALKARFGREDLQIEVYVRELLKLIISNTVASSKVAVSSLYDQLESHIRSLESLGITSEKCGPILFPLIESCLPEDLLRVWQRSVHSSKSFENVSEGVHHLHGKRLQCLMDFLRSEVESDQRFDLANERFGIMKIRKDCIESKFVSSKLSTATGLINQHASRDIRCIFCEKSHDSANCYKAAKWSYDRRKQVAVLKKACYQCLRVGHQTSKCAVFVHCIICQKPHATLMCPTLPSRQEDSNKLQRKSGDSKLQQSLESLTHTGTNSTSSHVFLQTLKVTLSGVNNSQKVRVLIDTGSQNTYILQSTAERLGYQSTSHENILHSLFGGKKVKNSHHRYNVIANHGDYTCSFQALSQDKICDSVLPIFSGPWMEELQELNIAVSDFGDISPIELLIGSDLAGKLYTGGRRLLKCGLVAIETLLGWTLMGKAPLRQEDIFPVFDIAMFINDARIENLWTLDVLGIADPGEKKSREELSLEVRKFFEDTTSIDAEGRYEVRLPWIQGHPALADNLHLARRRLEHTLGKLEKQKLFAEYNAVFMEWLSDGVIEEVPKDAVVPKDAHYLPHHAVVKLSSATTKIRPVFDASAREKRNPSLNQCLEKGVNLVELIPNILLGFRKYRIGVTSDIRKAFLQVSINEKDRDVLRFLWVNDTGEEIIFRHRRVVFGLTCSPFLLGATIETHLHRALEDRGGCGDCISAENVKKLATSFYVDNCVTSVPEESTLRTFISEASMIMSRGQFDLRGWEYSSSMENEESNSMPLLGLFWNKLRDTLSVNPDVFEGVHRQMEKPVTKRVMLSMAQRIFDPIGFSCPTTLLPKLLLQRTWLEKSGWDDPVNNDIRIEFNDWLKEIEYLKCIEIPRWIGFESTNVNWSLHTFCDASQNAYAAAVFLRRVKSGTVDVILLAAKSRVAPTKKLTIPRLELMAAVIGTRLCCSVKDGLKENVVQEFFWSDSSTVISWIKRSDKWSVFVTNRVVEIIKLSSAEDWFHVPGTENPADMLSRGVKPKALLSSRWWEGPSWLYLERQDWPGDSAVFDEDEINNEKRSTTVVMSCMESRCIWNLTHFSKYEKIVRMIAWVKRFVRNSRSSDRRDGELSTDEVEDSEKFVLRIVQDETFTGEGAARLKNFNHFTEEGLIRLKTRISERDDTQIFRYPIVLPAEHHVVKRMVYDFHVKQCHVRTQGLIAAMRERYWILGGRRAINSIISKCVTCKRHLAKPFACSEAVLPVDRVREAAAFEVTGVDFAGPLHLRSGEKVWVCVFTCGVYRAVHFEICTTLAADNFIKALRRFISRRGRPTVIYSDNATNFVKTAKELDTLDWQNVAHKTSGDRIRWRFNPPAAPWWGGFWERVIGVLKSLLRRVLGRALVNYEDLITILCECESVINSRPLTYLSGDSEDLIALTPMMFLRERQSDGLPDENATDVEFLNRRAKYLLRLRDELKKRFRREYLGQLAVLQKGRVSRAATVGEIVLIENNESKIRWPMGRIVEVYPGKDGEIRVVKVETATGKLLRPVKCLFPLECQPEDFEEAETKKQRVTRSGRVVIPPKRFR